MWKLFHSLYCMEYNWHYILQMNTCTSASEREMQLDRDVGLEQSLAIGMYVRFPFEAERSDNEFRDFRIGQIRRINTIARTVLVRVAYPDADEASENDGSI